MMASFDGGDAGPAASNVADESSTGDAGAGLADARSASPAAECSVESSKMAVSSGTDEVAAGELDKLKLSTLKELTVVSSFHGH